MSDEGTIIQKIDGWLAAAVAGALNLLLMTWIKIMGGRTHRLEERVDEIESGKADAGEFRDHKRTNDAQHDAMFRKIDGLHKKIDESRREIKGDIRMVADLIRSGKNSDG